MKHSLLVAFALCAICAFSASLSYTRAQDLASSRDSIRTKDPLRAPAYPLVAVDPYFSVWSNTDNLADSFPVHWTGRVNALTSLVSIDGKAYRLMGVPQVDGALPDAMRQTQVAVRATNTAYTFEDAGVEISLVFTNPNLPDDLELLSRPATYLSWTAISTDGKEHDVKIYFDATAELCVNSLDQNVVAQRVPCQGLDVLRVGTEEQPILAKSGDDLRIDWGYLYLAVKEGDANTIIAPADEARESFVKNASLPAEDDKNFPRQASDDWPVLALSFDCGKVGNDAVSKMLALAYDDVYSMTWFGEKLKPYWRKDGADALSLLQNAVKEYDSIVERCRQFDDSLWRRAESLGGEKYASLCSIAYPQAIAAHKLSTLPNGKLIFISKENLSGGCAGTVDVLYPGAPLFVVYNIELLKGTMTPIMEYSRERWPWPYAPHDLGCYPLMEGQMYGGGEKTEERQMPVEECANMLVLFDVVARAENSVEYATEYWDLLQQWAHYLVEKGLDPENQLCTDDFTGHFAHNANLSIKAIVALACYSDLCQRAGKEEDAKFFREKAEEFAAKWPTLADDGDHYRLAFDRPGSWSQKYNVVWDKLLGLNLFSKDIVKKELAFYPSVSNRYGLPLDNRADFTKADWIAWVATLADDRQGFDQLMNPLYDFVNDTPDRVPLTDWYFTSDAKMKGFRARSVVGGLFIKMLENELK